MFAGCDSFIARSDLQNAEMPAFDNIRPHVKTTREKSDSLTGERNLRVIIPTLFIERLPTPVQYCYLYLCADQPASRITEINKAVYTL